MSRRSRRDAEAEEARQDLAAVRVLVEEDVVALGEQLAGADVDVAGLPPRARVDLRSALDAYESAKDALDSISDADRVSTVVDTLAAGRFALARVLAAVEGSEPPTRRTPCFFDTRHGPASTDVRWAAPGRGTRTVPACAADADRLASGQRPQLRTVRIHGRTVPAWEAGAAWAPYGEGWHSSGS